MRTRRLAATLAALALLAPDAQAQTVGAVGPGPGGLSYQQARARFPQLTHAMFDKADRDGDGTIDARELPTLQGVYTQMTQRR